MKLPNVYFGDVTKQRPDWREVPDDPDPDDEELPETPPELVMILGFDPKDDPDFFA